jgi:hypothetical protein
VQFPIYTDKSAFLENLPDRLPGVASRPIDFINARHKYVGGQATNDTLLRLSDLSNDDKHRTLKPMVTTIVQIKHHMTLTRCVPLRYEGPSDTPEVKPDALIGRLICQIIGAEWPVSLWPSSLNGTRGTSR